MPIALAISVNERLVSQFHISRVGGGLDRIADKEHVYSVFKSLMPEERRRGVASPEVATFTHRYGDGVEVCTLKALETVLAQAAPATPREVHFPDKGKGGNSILRALEEHYSTDPRSQSIEAWQQDIAAMEGYGWDAWWYATPEERLEFMRL